MVRHGRRNMAIAYCQKQNEGCKDSFNALAFGFATGVARAARLAGGRRSEGTGNAARATALAAPAALGRAADRRRADSFQCCSPFFSACNAFLAFKVAL